MKKVEVLAFKGYPHIAAALEQARVAVERAGVEADIHFVLVEDEATAKRLRFLGSPTVRVDGVGRRPSGSAPRSTGSYVGCTS